MSLQKLGITLYGEKIYKALLAYGSSSAKELSKRSGVPQTAIYPNVQQLEEQGFVQRVDGSIQRFEAIEPKTALSHLVSQKMKEFEQTKDAVTKELSTIKQQQEIIHTPIRLSQGKEQSITFSNDLVSKTKHSFFVLGWNLNHKKSVFEVIKMVRPLKKKGVDVRFLFTYKTTSGVLLREFLDKEQIPYRFVKTGFLSIVVSDANRCKITLKKKELSERVNLAVEDEDLAQAMHQYFLKLWRTAHHEREFSLI